MRPATSSIDGRRSHAAALSASLLAVAFFQLDVPGARAQSYDPGVINREHQIKAAFLYNFGRYVQWPAEAFADAEAPFVIGVLGSSPVASNLRPVAQTKKIQERPVLIRQFSDPKEMARCHILFVSADVEPETQAKAVQRCLGQPVLLVGENGDFVQRGGMIDMRIEGNRVRVYVALKAAQREALVVSSKLLQVAQVVDQR